VGKIIAKAKAIQKPRIKMGTMADNHAQPVSHPAMDSAKHEKTYRLFPKIHYGSRGPHPRLAGFVLRVTAAEPV
jgi:hypothetical protein